MNRFLRAMTVGVLVLLAPVAAHAIPVFTNQSFEAGTTGWTFSGGAQILSGNGPGFDGTFWAWVGRRDAPAALIQQTVAGFNVGGTYKLSFLMASESLFYGKDTVNVSIVGGGTLTQDFTSSPGATCCWNVWEQFDYTFLANAPSLTFQIHGYPDGAQGHPSADAGVDRFLLSEVAVVPLPAAGLLVGTGLVMLAGFRRRGDVRR